MDFSKIFIKDANPTKMGGQAVMEGIMMKGADRSVTAVRRSDGSINIKESPLPPKKEWMRWPIVRGVMTFVDSLVTGTKTLMYSASIVEEDIEYEEEEAEPESPGRLEQWIGDRFGEKGVFNFLLYSSVAIALIISVGVFVLLPTWVVGLCKAFTSSSILLNLIEGILRIGMFIIYVALISQMQDIKRVFQYHGAEHQTIHCFENGLELTPANCATFETLHPRCGTSFIMFVFIISLLLFSFLGWPNVAIRLVSRIVLIPVVAGLSYELLRWAGRSDTTLVKALSVPGLLMQKLTTRIPDESMLEVAIAAVNVCLSDTPPTERIFDTDGKGNTIDREVWKKAGKIAEGDISPEGCQSMTGEAVQTVNSFGADVHDENSEDSFEAQCSPEAMQETIIFAELLKELERPDPARKESAKDLMETEAIHSVAEAAEMFAEKYAEQTGVLTEDERRENVDSEAQNVEAGKKTPENAERVTETAPGAALEGEDAELSGEKFEEEITESFGEIFRKETIELTSRQVEEIIGSFEQKLNEEVVESSENKDASENAAGAGSVSAAENAEGAESVSAAENAEGAESVSAAENAEGAESVSAAENAGAAESMKKEIQQ